MYMYDVCMQSRCSYCYIHHIILAQCTTYSQTLQHCMGMDLWTRRHTQQSVQSHSGLTWSSMLDCWPPRPQKFQNELLDCKKNNPTLHSVVINLPLCQNLWKSGPWGRGYICIPSPPPFQPFNMSLYMYLHSHFIDSTKKNGTCLHYDEL